MAYDIPTMVSEATGVLKSLIAIPSLSRDEEKAADYLQNYIELQGMATGRKGNNVWCLSPMFDLNKPTLLLNSHIDTVKAVNGWRPFYGDLRPAQGHPEYGAGDPVRRGVPRILCGIPDPLSEKDRVWPPAPACPGVHRLLPDHLWHGRKRGGHYHDNFRPPLFLHHEVFLSAARAAGRRYLGKLQKCLHHGGRGMENHAAAADHGGFAGSDAAAVYLSGASVLYHHPVCVQLPSGLFLCQSAL